MLNIELSCLSEMFPSLPSDCVCAGCKCLVDKASAKQWEFIFSQSSFCLNVNLSRL